MTTTSFSTMRMRRSRSRKRPRPSVPLRHGRRAARRPPPSRIPDDLASEPVREPERPGPGNTARSDSRVADKVVNLNSGGQLKVVLVAPKQFELAAEIADHLRDRRAVLMNLEQTDKNIARRLIDFLSGVAYAQDGKIRRVASATYIITPFNVDLMGDQLDDMESGEFHL